MVKLDLKDKRILYELDINSRQSFKEIARKVGISKDSAIYRINRLKEEGIIKQFHTLIDVGKLGLMSFRLYLKLEKTNPQKEEEIIEFLKEQKLVTWIASMEGDYDLALWILTESISEMNQFWKNLFDNFRDFIKIHNLSIFTNVKYFSRNFLLDKSINKLEYVFITEPNEIKIDEKDKKIIKLLSNNSRISILEISDKLKMTSKTISSRIKELEKRKIIVGYRTMFNLEKLGYEYFKIHFNFYNLTKQKEKEFKSYIRNTQGLIYENEVLGGDEVEIEFQVKSLSELRETLNKLKNKFSDIIKNYKYFTFYKEYKFIFYNI